MKNEMFVHTQNMLYKSGDYLLKRTNSMYAGELLERFGERLQSVEDIKDFATAVVATRMTAINYALDIENYGDQLTKFSDRLRAAVPNDAYVQLLASTYEQQNELAGTMEPFNCEVPQDLAQDDIIRYLNFFLSKLSHTTAGALLKQLKPQKFDFAFLTVLVGSYHKERYKVAEVGAIHSMLIHAWRLSRNEIYDLHVYAEKLKMTLFETMQFYKYVLLNCNVEKISGPAQERLCAYFNEQYYYFEEVEPFVVSPLLDSIVLENVHPTKRETLIRNTERLLNVEKIKLNTISVLDDFPLTKDDVKNVLLKLAKCNDSCLLKIPLSELEVVESYRLEKRPLCRATYFSTLLRLGIYSLDNPRILVDAGFPMSIMRDCYKETQITLLEVLTLPERMEFFERVSIKDLEQVNVLETQKMVMAYLETLAYHTPHKYTDALIDLFKANLTGIDNEELREVLIHIKECGIATITQDLAEITLNGQERLLFEFKTEVEKRWSFSQTIIEDYLTQYQECLENAEFQEKIAGLICRTGFKEAFNLLEKVKAFSFDKKHVDKIKVYLRREVSRKYKPEELALLKFVVQTMEKGEIA